ncbi:MAG TPA: carboxypeptidase-like regulatory domain-containing protein, partial [Pyrinomonadaceae bacterium]|nr:carboxypeptidase-like regulatory domain-containing protein [Pyrinomonadaceae bacterium]
MNRGTVITGKLFLALVGILICGQTGFARLANDDTAVIGGRVLDSQNAGVAGAIVTLYARGRASVDRIASVTDETGAYRFARLAAPDEYIIEVEAAGFARFASSVNRVGRGQSLALDIRLEVAGVNAEIVVTAAGVPQTVDEVSKAVTVIGRRELEERDEFSI